MGGKVEPYGSHSNSTLFDDYGRPLACFQVPDEAVSKCTSCSDFGAFNRRHRCRNCVGVFCDKCTQGRIALTAEENVPQVRVCDPCMAEVSQRLSYTKESASRNVSVQSHGDVARKLQGRIWEADEGSSLSNMDSALAAEFLGVKPTLPPYLKPGLTQEDLITGVSFASGGSGYDPLTPIVVSAIPMSNQLTYFQEYIEKVKGFVGKEKAEHIISKSLAIVIAGSDDLANTYYGTHAEELLYDIDAYTSYMASSAASFAMQLYESGARKIGFVGVPPIGCLPIQRTSRGGLKRKCADKVNVAAQLFNTKLSRSLHSVAETLKNATLVYIDIYALCAQMIQNPKEYGFDDIDRGCCGTGLVELGPLCNQFTSLLCSNVSSYMFWDSYHPTERAYRILTKKFVETDMSPFYDK
ncbi:hypothetical protein Bca52824_014333 [Brassica carinata]|uniref:FYVE-type domain-containing protein n=1 Tax=Brassica carinata TaxID=52824 RepID=A0A8X7W2Q3_BRACI|nr:hypothetical protein Bca52824_014333 [Brassica carinata]